MFQSYSCVKALALTAVALCLQSAAFSQTVNTNYLKNLRIRSIGPAGMSGRITAIEVDPVDPNIIYAGAASGGVWRSKSGGTAWEPITEKMPTQSIGAIAINPKNPDEIWVGTGEGNPRNSQNFGVGIFKSIDGGKNWQCMGLKNSRTIHRVLIHRDNPDIVWVAAMGSTYGPTEERGVFKTVDGGKTWKKVLYINDLTGCAELVQDARNPNKIIAAMWEYRRWPWDFKSGGKGSGIHVSFDGGETWEKRTSADGLPEGELGRVGLAISQSNPDIVYALVEAKDNALYKSYDGGKKWQKMADKGMGDRPFYYAEIYVDPKNENRVYSIFTYISKSEDGGNSFDNWSGYRIHPDHHAFYIHPSNPDYIIEGNDGGLNITLDRGRTWRFAENIPVGQWYHINVDMETPYNIYGGLQDNGSWVGPSSVWKSGGIRNSDWMEILFGDGFDAMPQRNDNRYCFAQSQGGYLARIDKVTGATQGMRPLHPEGKNLRFNWNAALAQDPAADCGIYFGSQYLHYSRDCGQSWDIISPDLTTNDTSKLHQDKSGGLTPDATNAENHCTILAIAPGVLDRGVVWVGTDDGNIQLTRDQGQTWTNMTPEIKGFPKNAWIPQIEISSKNAGEVFVVVNNYRQNDWEPYLYHTADYGKTWKRLVDGKKVEGYCLSVVQDAKVPGLLFLGTDQGLYFSINYGETWTKWNEEGFPSVPVIDMKIHPREDDLVIATFGRSLWIMDDINPLRELARTEGKLFDQPLKAIASSPGIYHSELSYSGVHFAGSTYFAGESKDYSPKATFWLDPKAVAAEKTKKKDDKKGDKKEEKKPDAPASGGGRRGRRGGGGGSGEKATIVITNMAGDTLRKWKTTLDTCFNKISWGGDTRGIRFPSNDEPDAEQLEPGGGPTAPPGTYKMTVVWQEKKDSALLVIEEDRKSTKTVADYTAKTVAFKQFYGVIEGAAKTYTRMRDIEKTIKRVEDMFAITPDSTKKEVVELGKTIKDSIGVYKELFFVQKEGKGIQRNPNGLNSKFYSAISYLNDAPGAPNKTAETAMDIAQKASATVQERINSFLDPKWKLYKEKVEQIKVTLFKE